MARYKVVPGYIVRKFLDEYLLVPVESPGKKHSKMGILNPVAQFLWLQLQKEKSPEELVGAVCAEFEVDEDTARNDIREFLEILRSNDCLEEMEE